MGNPPSRMRALESNPEKLPLPEVSQASLYKTPQTGCVIPVCTLHFAHLARLTFFFLSFFLCATAATPKVGHNLFFPFFFFSFFFFFFSSLFPPTSPQEH
jgi:hypothetical protein